MVAFPLLATIISLACAILATQRYIARHRPYELSWAIAFGFFALGAGAASLGYLIGWNALLVRLFYSSGAILTTAFLGVGSLYLLLGSRLDRWGPGAMLIVTAFTFASVFNTPVDPARLGEAWYALQTAGTPTRALAIVANIFGATVVVGGALYSVSVGLRRGMPRDRAFGVLLIAVGDARRGEREFVDSPPRRYRLPLRRDGPGRRDYHGRLSPGEPRPPARRAIWGCRDLSWTRHRGPGGGGGVRREQWVSARPRSGTGRAPGRGRRRTRPPAPCGPGRGHARHGGESCGATSWPG